MKYRLVRTVLLGMLLSLAGSAAAWAQTGKIAGRVTEAGTGEPLPGVNVLIVGSTQGTTTDIDGYYSILNVSPGTYEVRATFVGFTPVVAQDVEVNIDLTTTVDFELREQVIEGEEVVVTASRPVVQPDMSASVANISSAKIEQLPVSTISSVVGLQAGVQGLSVRGSGSSELSFNLNGLTLRDERNNTPFTTISLTSVEEVQVQTGGFNAEYGNVRSGVVNVVTKEGDRSRYAVDAILRYSPAASKHFGAPANDPNSYWIRPFIDPAVAWTGTANGAWDQATQEQYAPFQGWVAISEDLLEDDDPTNDMTPEALQQAFLWQHRKSFDITEPDYTLDVGVGGPVPGLNRWGDTRFFASLRRNQNMYLVPLSRDRYEEQSAHVKLTSDVGPGMKLSLEGLLGEETGTASSRSGAPGIFNSTFSIAGQMDQVNFIDTRLFATDYWAPTRVARNMLGAKFTHAVSPKTFYEVRFTRFASDYDTNPGRLRDTTAVVEFGGVGFDEAPFGYMPLPSNGVDGMRMGVGMSNARDTSTVVVYNLKSDFTSQVNRILQVKSGLEVNVTDSRVNYGQFDAFLPSSNTQARWDRTPLRGAFYGQGKLEFKGMIANLGLRLSYFKAGGDWYLFENNPYAIELADVVALDSLEQAPTDLVYALQPRLGVSFPVTAFSKLFFNYGHFRSLPDPNNLFLVREASATGQVDRLANPNNPLPKTIAYELGYEHSLFEQFLVRAAGYYKNVSLQPQLVNFVARSGQTDYLVSFPNSYEDIRGFELTFERNRGKWVQGFINYTYMVFSSGYFGFTRYYENKSEQRVYENDAEILRAAASKPVPRPYGRLNLDFLLPTDFGPSVGGLYPLADWRLSVLGSWQAGYYFTWTGGGAQPGVRNNVQFRDSWDVDLRFTKNFEVGGNRAQFFVDIYNVLNRKQMSLTGMVDGNDYRSYMESLHLPASDDYPNIPGNDRPGDYRDYDVPFVPIDAIQSIEQLGDTFDADRLYYEHTTGRYMEFDNGAWSEVPDARIQRILDDKAYIDMPNMSFLTFLNPRDVYWGIRISF